MLLSCSRVLSGSSHETEYLSSLGSSRRWGSLDLPVFDDLDGVRTGVVCNLTQVGFAGHFSQDEHRSLAGGTIWGHSENFRR